MIGVGRGPLDGRPRQPHPHGVGQSSADPALVVHVPWHELNPVLWLELTHSSGTVLYSRTGPVPPAEVAAVAERAIITTSTRRRLLR